MIRTLALLVLCALWLTRSPPEALGIFGLVFQALLPFLALSLSAGWIDPIPGAPHDP